MREGVSLQCEVEDLCNLCQNYTTLFSQKLGLFHYFTTRIPFDNEINGKIREKKREMRREEMKMKMKMKREEERGDEDEERGGERR
jgi:hypothetical protein